MINLKDQITQWLNYYNIISPNSKIMVLINIYPTNYIQSNMKIWNFTFLNYGIHNIITIFSYLLIKNDSPYLERFLASLCSRSVALYELINWCFVSYSDKDRMDKTKNERLTRIDSVLENAMATTNNSDSIT